MRPLSSGLQDKHRIRCGAPKRSKAAPLKTRRLDDFTLRIRSQSLITYLLATQLHPPCDFHNDSEAHGTLLLRASMITNHVPITLVTVDHAHLFASRASRSLRVLSKIAGRSLVFSFSGRSRLPQDHFKISRKKKMNIESTRKCVP